VIRAGLLTLVALAASGAAPLAGAEAAPLPPDLARLLARSDPFAAAPAELRLELSFVGANGAEVPLEIWRKGDERALVRFLAEKDRGKYVLRRGVEVWLLTPGAREPVKMSPALAPAGGAALDELLGLRLADDYTPVAVSEGGGVVTFDLVGVGPGVDPPKVRWVVGRTKGLPLRAEFRDARDRVRRLVEFAAWRDEAKRIPAEIVAKEVGRGTPLTVRIHALEARAVPEAIFDPADRAAREALPPPPPR
jgi:hypothetical protein